MPDAHKNFAVSTVATAPSPATSGTSLVVTAAEGTRFPAPATDGSFYATIWPTAAQPTPANAEIVKVTARSTDTLTITRAQRSSSARTVVVGDQIALGLYAEDLTAIEGRQLTPTAVKTSAYTAVSGDLVLCDTTTGWTGVMPTATAGAIVGWKKTSSDSNTLTVDPPGAVTIDGDTTATMTEQYAGFIAVADGTNWHIVQVF